MDVAKPGWFTSHWVHHDWCLPRRTGLQHFGIVISALTPRHFDAEIDLGVNGGRDQSLESAHEGCLQGFREIVNPSKERELHDRVSNIALVELFHKVRVKITEDATTIGDQEFSSRFGGLEADKSGGPRSTGSDKLIVHTCRTFMRIEWSVGAYIMC
jgi:hypothetical protein